MIMGAFNVLWVRAVIRQMLDERGMREKGDNYNLGLQPQSAIIQFTQKKSMRQLGSCGLRSLRHGYVESNKLLIT